MGPKTFTPCYVCSKEFGSKSLTFHEPRCLERWRSFNKALPVEKRTTTPTKPSKSNKWSCPDCNASITSSGKNQHSTVCVAKKLKSNNAGSNIKRTMTGAVKTDFSPKKGKENKKNGMSLPNDVLKKNARNETLNPVAKTSEGAKPPEVVQREVEEVVSTSNRSVRPQTKILRRPTPNLNHPVIQVDSDDSSSGGDSSSSEKSKEDENPKRLKMAESSDPQKPKNFIMYNKYNVEKNTKIAFRERSSANASVTIPNPCNSCNRSQAPERLHSHAKKDSRGLMFRRSPSLDVKMTSPQKKVSSDTSEKPPKTASKKLGDKLDHALASPVKSSEENKKNFQEDSNQPTLTTSASDTTISELNDIEKACYICQKELKVSSLLLHESKCLEAWKKVNNSLTPNLRKLPPRRPEEPDTNPCDENDPAWTTVQSQLVPCGQCGRTFFPERLPVHRRVCKGKPSPRALKRTSSLRESSTDGSDDRPCVIYVPCYVCGRSFGSWVISMHEEQCIRRWRAENSKLPPEDQLEEPKKFHTMTIDEDVASLVELGDKAWESHLQQLVPCPLCARTFFPDRLGVHKRSCKGPPTSSRRPKSNNGT